MNKPIASVARTNEILKKFDLYAKKGYGQNFIIEPGIVRKIAENAQGDNQCIIEIGPGIGALTEQLALRAKRVIAYEIDDRLIDVLAYSLSEYNNVEIIHEDFLQMDFDQLIKELKKQYEKIVVCANLPYYITTPILFKIFESKEEVDCITVMVQKEVADRFCANKSTKDYNALSVITQYLYDAKTIMKIPRTIFNPKPNIDSAVVQFNKKSEKNTVDNEAAFFEFVKGCFKQRRKTLYNNLKELGKQPEVIKKCIDDAGLSETIRAEACDLDKFIELYNLWREL
ncbi:16S rRNA (adenine(1518)-N(6)/adenine(1519)-N(6))-dimethyltransferase RsmA [Anaerorhabdus furcosa]|uniref:Ribosomal RNA small subunit methyltransferase A n=1 Tax=Anaerorhabdus furcosa TaxID=118967 RepID=A0A1T4MSN8_9FIRM|nr:16S rRNA (adenine(1518)-N(6)/adenine(1519)-N(6))-dimethyltransferase RsmA [Anaerorhabdus furcosa]SJZ69814.1 16S rRNA (adenine1518-N6/adenine1519-N6)-dimethyltransferase [Anaerorhabdus furcosa]